MRTIDGRRCTSTQCPYYNKTDSFISCKNCTYNLGNIKLPGSISPPSSSSPFVLGFDPVNKVKHYQLFEDVEVIDVIAKVLGDEGFMSYCHGNMIKYVLRAGKKDATKQDIDKANTYARYWKNIMEGSDVRAGQGT